jgi:hypothetical protein
VILVVSLPLVPAAFVDPLTVLIAVIAFLAITVRKVDVALVAVGAIVGGIVYAAGRALLGR